MAYRGNVLGIFDGLTNNLYSSHKLIGIIILRWCWRGSSIA